MLFPISPGSKGPHRCLGSFENHSHLLCLQLTHGQKPKPKHRHQKLKKNVGKKNLQLVKILLFFSFSYNWDKTDRILIIVAEHRTLFPLDSISESKKRREGRPGDFSPCSTASGRPWLGGLYVPSSSQVREDFRTRRQGGGKRHLIQLCLDSPLLLPVGRKFVFTMIVSANQKGDRAAWEEARHGHARHTQRYLNLPRPMELISPCSDLMGTSCVYLVPGWGCGFTQKQITRFERTHVSNHIAVTRRVHTQSGFWPNYQFGHLYWWHQPCSIPFHKYCLNSYCVPALNYPLRMQTFPLTLKSSLPPGKEIA